MKLLFFIISLVLMLTGCSQKEFTDGAKGIGNDISNFGDKLFEVRE